jgi:hypothetical protein
MARHTRSGVAGIFQRSPPNDRSLQQGFDNAICANRGAPPQSEM